MKAEEREWVRREIDRAKRLRMKRREIDKAEYRAEHGIQAEKNAERAETLRVEAAALMPSPDGQCLAIVSVGKWTQVVRCRCSRRATMGRFCRTHERRRVGEIGGS